MNKSRRAELRSLEDLLEKKIQPAAAVLVDLLQQALEQAENARDGEQDSYDSLPESLQESSPISDSLARLEELVEGLESHTEAVRDLHDSVQALVGLSDEAKGEE